MSINPIEVLDILQLSGYDEASALSHFTCVRYPDGNGEQDSPPVPIDIEIRTTFDRRSGAGTVKYHCTATSPHHELTVGPETNLELLLKKIRWNELIEPR